MTSKINIAIDGPAGAGKSTVAKCVAERLSYVYIDTGAMYRALTWKALQDKEANLNNEQTMIHLLQHMTLQLIPKEKGQQVMVDGEDVSELIREEWVSTSVSTVAGHKLVRAEMVKRQQKLAAQQGVVMDGRDIGTHVLPSAQLKIYLNASLEERAKRRFLEWQDKGKEVELDVIKESIRHRDDLDSNRQFSPLHPAIDAVHLDTTGLSIAQVVNQILKYAQDEQVAKGE